MNDQNALAGTVLVGYDGSPGSQAALEWALAEGTRLGAPVHLRYAFEWVSQVGVFATVPYNTQDLRRDAQQVVDEAVAAAAATHPHLYLSGDVVDGAAAAVLTETSRYTRLVVLGHSGLGGFTGLLLGSVAVAVTAHAHCPVVVVRGGPPAVTLPVWVGVDGSPESDLAAGFAFDEAARRGVPLAAIHAWEPPPVPSLDAGALPGQDPAAVEEAERQLLDQDLKYWRDKYPHVAVQASIVPARPARALVEVSHRAQLVVVGSRGRGGFRGLLLGSVSQQLLHHAACPVAVVREGHAAPDQ